jgi:hypothetical protein
VPESFFRFPFSDKPDAVALPSIQVSGSGIGMVDRVSFSLFFFLDPSVVHSAPDAMSLQYSPNPELYFYVVFVYFIFFFIYLIFFIFCLLVCQNR